MPSLAMYKITPPSDFAEFEKMCKDFLQKKYSAETQLWGRKGQSQNGVDILVQLQNHSYSFAQCKNVKSVSTSKLNDWIVEAEKCTIKMNEFIIMVAIENDVTLQEHICNVSSKRVEQGKWPVKIFFWDDIVHSIKSDQTMLRLYYPELYQGHIEVLAEASMDASQKYPTMIQNAHELRKSFFKEAVAQRIEEFLECDPTNGIPLDLANSADVFGYAIRKLIQRSPMLIASNSYTLINDFLNSLNNYHSFLVNVTETTGFDTFIVHNRYHTADEESDIKEVEKLRIEAIEKYKEIKEEALY